MQNTPKIYNTVKLKLQKILIIKIFFIQNKIVVRKDLQYNKLKVKIFGVAKKLSYFIQKNNSLALEM